MKEGVVATTHDPAKAQGLQSGKQLAKKSQG